MKAAPYQDRVAVVTGAGSGIGRHLTIALARDGAQVAAADINEDGLAETQSACLPERVSTHVVDVADREAVQRFADGVRHDRGAASMVFNNAGVDLFATAAEMSWADFDWLMSINVGGVVNGTKAFLPQLLETGSRQRPARLVNLSSAFGLIAFPFQSAYCMSKFAVRGFTESVRQEMLVARQPVTVHCVHPGIVSSNFGFNMRTASSQDRDAALRSFQKAAMSTPEKAASVILSGVRRNRARIIVGPDGWVFAAMPRLLGIRYTDLAANLMRMAGPKSGVKDRA